MSKPKAYSYLRFSTAEQLKGDSLRRQSQLADDYARAHNLVLDTELSLRDLGVSAFRGANLGPQGALGLFLDAITKGLVPAGSFLLVESLDRLSRKTARKALRALEQIVEAGVTVVTLNDGKAFTEESLDGLDLFMALVVMMRAHEESLTKARRLKAAWHGKRLQMDKKVLTSITPGWIELDAERKPVLIAERAKVVRRIVRDYLRGVGKHGIAKALNAEKVPTFSSHRGRASQWHRSYVDKMLNSPALVGTFVPHVETHDDDKFRRVPQEPVPNYFPGVIDAETYARVQALTMRSPSKGRRASASVQNILSGLARCPLCDGSMTRAVKGKRTRPALVCVRAKTGAGCAYRSVPYADVEHALLNDYASVLRDMPHPDRRTEKELRGAQALVDELEGRMTDLLDLVERKPSDALASRIASLEVQLKDARETRDELTERAAQSDSKAMKQRADDLGVALRARPVDRRRANAALKALVDGVTVDWRTGHLRFHWLSGGISETLYAWPQEATES